NRGEPHRLTVNGDLAARVVDAERPGRERGALVVRDLRLGAAEHGADAGEQLDVREGLGDVIVSAHLEATDFIHIIVSRSQDHDRYFRELADAAQHLEAVDVRKADVEDDDVGPIVAYGFNALLSGGRAEEFRLGPTEPECQSNDLNDVGLVFDDEYSHGGHCKTSRQ